MDVKTKITDFKDAMKRARRLAAELDAAMDPRPRSPKLTGMPRSGQNTTLDLQMEIIEAAQIRFDKAREEALEQLSELEDLIDQLPEWEQKCVLYFRHVYGWKWSKVADEMHCHERTAQRIHAKAIKEMQKSEK